MERPAATVGSASQQLDVQQVLDASLLQQLSRKRLIEKHTESCGVLQSIDLGGFSTTMPIVENHPHLPSKSHSDALKFANKNVGKLKGVTVLCKAL